MATGRSRKKNKFKLNERSTSSIRDKYTDPSFTEDVRHLALPLRRNSGPESEALKMFGKKKSKSQNSKEEHSSHYSLRLERRKKSQANNYSAEYLCKNSSSSESLDNIISSYKGRKGFSLDRNVPSFDEKPQVKPKRSSWFLRDKSRDKTSNKDKFFKRASLDYTVTYSTKSEEKPRTKAKTIQRQNAADYTGDSSTTQPDDNVEPPKKSGLSRFSIGKRFLKGEIGIRSFNYYLLKEGLKKNQGKQKQESISAKSNYKSKSEENIYEEIYFRHDQPTPKPRTPPALPPFNKQSSVPVKTDDDNCRNCEICLQEAQQEKHSSCGAGNCDKCPEKHVSRLMTSSLSGSEGYAKVTKRISEQSIYDFFQQQQKGQTMLQFETYNPSTNMYKTQMTPVAFDYNPIEEQIYQMELNQQYARPHQQQSYSGDGRIVPKSSSSSDSIKGQNRQRQQQSNEFYTRPNYFYPPSSGTAGGIGEKQSKMYKTDSSNSIRSENSLNKIYNSGSQKSNQSNKSVNSNHNRGAGDEGGQIRQDMSDSSLGDSLFSSDANKRYFGSSESCRFNYECRRRCSLENEKCSFSDTCRYECNLRNCDCSSSYFSSDFDDTNIYNSTRNHHQPLEQQIYDQKNNRYAEDFIKHVSNVKRRSQNNPAESNNVLITAHHIYEVPKLNPKRLETEFTRNENDNVKTNANGDVVSNKVLMQGENKNKATGTISKLSSISSNDSKKKSSQNKQKDMNRDMVNDGESLPKAKAVEEKNQKTDETVSAAIEMKMKGKSPEEEKKALLMKDEQQKNVEIEDDDDDVFLENRQKETEKKTGASLEKPQNKQSSDGKKAKVVMEMANVSMPAKSSPFKAPAKALPNETLKVEVKQAGNAKSEEKLQTNEGKNNNKDTVCNEAAVESEDDSVFINENKPKKGNKTSVKHKNGEKTLAEPATANASSVMLSKANVSSSNGKPVAPNAAQNLNSRDLNVESERVVRDPQGKHIVKTNEKNAKNPDKNKSNEAVKHSNDPSDQLDFSNIPLPEIPTKKKQLSKGKSLSKDSLPTSASAKIQSKWKQLTDKDYFKKMHYRNSSLEKKPTYLFGETVANNGNKTNDGIFLNRSGWIQTNQRFDKGSESRKENINKLKAANSKIEELISRNEARKANQQMAKDDNITILKIDPKSDARQILNDRPGFLPVKTNLAHHGPPPTPILSPPPAFQDHKIRNRIIEMKNGTRIQLSVTDSDNKTTPAQIGKGMVFSRSFEYDNRKTAEFNENFSRSFDFDFQLNENSGMNKNFLTRYGKSTTFASLTGVSPNYLTKKEKTSDTSPSTSMTSIFPKVIPGNKVKMGNYFNPNYKSVDEGISKRSQFTRPGMANAYRSLETNTSTANNRLNSCDSGARSDFSNDDLDEDPHDSDEDNDPSSSLALSYKSSATASYIEPIKNNRNITKTLLNQQQNTQFKKTRSMTPETSFDDYDLLTVSRSNSKKQRSLTPEKRSITPELLNKSSKLTTSQTSLMSRQSSGSRNSTLERQLKRYEEGRLSRSSSSSSEADNNNRRTTRPPFKTNFGDYRIRRSRSLQLSERSPNRSQLQKVVVRIGNTPAPQSTNLSKHREKPDYAHTRSKTQLNMPSKYNSQSLRNSDNSLPSSTQAKSYEMLDFNGKSNVDYGFESDSKSKSFDDDFCFNTKVTRNGNNNRNAFSGNRAFSQDRVLLAPPAAVSKSLRNSPRNYGSRLYDHDMLYDVASRRAMTRSPVMNYNNRIPVNPPLSRERSPVGGRRSRDRERENYKKSSSNFLKPRTTTTPNRSPNRSPSDSDDSINESANKILKDKSLVAEYLFGLKRKQQAGLSRSGNQSGTPSSSSGSCCTSSSCEYWPQNSGSNPIKNPSESFVNGSHKKSNVQNDSDSSGSVKVSVNTQKLKQQAFHGATTTVTINGGQAQAPPSMKRVNNKPNNSSIIFLGDCEMPITKSVTRKNSGSDLSANKMKENNTQKIQITARPSGEMKQQFAASQQIRAQNYGKGKFFTPSYSSDTNSTVKRRHFTRLQSRSLPKSFMRSRNLSSDANELSAMFPPHSPLQMRAVSSPSLTEAPTETQSNSNPSYSSKPEPNSQTHHDIERGHPNASSGSVLQKFKKTFFKNGKSHVPVAESLESNESKHHRFGPLVWRSSKERRKTKSHRRDKCNSGDSGIQVELENDENLSENVQSHQSMDISPQPNVKVRRANSAKVSTTSSIKLSSHRKETKGSAASSINSKRSLSQPSDLDVIVCENKMMNNLDNIKHIDDDDGSDTDSLTSNHVEDIDDDGQPGVVYAEVLYPFQAGGPHELSLEKGSLVEVIKRESGPWWWGRLKFDAVVGEETVEIQQGWFPRDFVKVIPAFGHNRRIITQSSTEYDCDNHLASLPPTSAAPTISSSQSNSEIMRDNVIKELLETEINYVKLLNSLVEGFIKEMREQPEIFSLESIFLIFSNMEQIYRFQQTFLEALRLAIPNGRIAEVFLEFQSAFMVYSQYCNSYPRALMELENISGNKEASAVLENCRIAQNLPELPLSAHLLAPIQRICRYPLHLSELVKHSRTRKEILLKLDVHQLSKQDLETIDSKEMFEVALNAMKRVTEMVNEGKRHSEYLSRIQSRFESFQGPSINVHSTRLFLQTDAIRVSPNLWNNTYTLFLFDRQLIYCKKDLLKRTSYIYKGRIFLDNCRILNLPDGKMFGVNLKNALRMFCETRGKWFDFCFRSSSSKMRFLNTLSAERQFCGASLFVSELAPGIEDENLSDDANGLHQDYDERGIDVDPQTHPPNGSLESPLKQQKFSDTLPKKPRKLSKDVPSQIIIDYNPSSASSNMNKRRLGNWFRKSKSTNSTPSQSPTHHPLVATSTVPSIVNHSDSNSSSQSSPVNYPRQKFKEEPVVGASS